MSFGSYSAVADNNQSLNGIFVGENCAAANVNNAIRLLAADGRELYDTVAAISVSSYMPLAGGAFTGNITRSGAGAFSYYVSSTLISGAEYVQPVADALPSSPAEGTKVYQY
jgi:hypothetical protein